MAVPERWRFGGLSAPARGVVSRFGTYRGSPGFDAGLRYKR